MSTRCTVSIKYPNDIVKGIYVHNYGYTEHTGVILLNTYNTVEKVEELISLGDSSVIYPILNPDPSIPHTFDNRQQGVSVFYHRDRDEEWAYTKPRVCLFEDYANSFCQSYNYIFIDGRWYLCDDDRNFIPLEDVIHET